MGRQGTRDNQACPSNSKQPAAPLPLTPGSGHGRHGWVRNTAPKLRSTTHSPSACRPCAPSRREGGRDGVGLEWDAQASFSVGGPALSIGGTNHRSRGGEGDPGVAVAGHIPAQVSFSNKKGLWEERPRPSLPPHSLPWCTVPGLGRCSVNTKGASGCTDRGWTDRQMQGGKR